MNKEETIRYRDAFPKDYDLPAFPDPNRTDLKGMSLRDYFAAKALQGMCANPDDSHENYVHLDYDDYAKEITRCAYIMADAMLEAREK